MCVVACAHPPPWEPGSGPPSPGIGSWRVKGTLPCPKPTPMVANTRKNSKNLKTLKTLALGRLVAGDHLSRKTKKIICGLGPVRIPAGTTSRSFRKSDSTSFKFVKGVVTELARLRLTFNVRRSLAFTFRQMEVRRRGQSARNARESPVRTVAVRYHSARLSSRLVQRHAPA